MQKTPLSDLNFRLVFVAWWFVWTGLQVIVLKSLGFSLNLSLTDSIVGNVLLSAACMLVTNNLRYYLPQRQRYAYLLGLTLVISALWLVISRWIIFNIKTDPAAYREFFDKSLSVRFSIAFLLVACMALISVVWYTLEDQKENEQRRYEREKISKEAELYKLRQQLQPHFLFNSLNSISALISAQPENARTMIHQLSDFLRKTLKKEEQQWVTLDEELEYLDLYLSIEKVRFGHRLATEISQNETSVTCKLPTMLLQPIVENAIKFGLYDTIGEITIRIKASREDDQLVIIVQNPFDPQTSQMARGTGFGLSSVNRRLQLLFARNDLLVTRSADEVFTTTVIIPQIV